MINEAQPVPDRLSVETSSPYYSKAVLAKGIEIEFDGVRQVNNIIEYCVSEGWVRRRRMTALGKLVVDSYHQPIIDTKYGVVRPYWR